MKGAGGDKLILRFSTAPVGVYCKLNFLFFLCIKLSQLIVAVPLKILELRGEVLEDVGSAWRLTIASGSGSTFFSCLMGFCSTMWSGDCGKLTGSGPKFCRFSRKSMRWSSLSTVAFNSDSQLSCSSCLPSPPSIGRTARLFTFILSASRSLSFTSDTLDWLADLECTRESNSTSSKLNSRFWGSVGISCDSAPTPGSRTPAGGASNKSPRFLWIDSLICSRFFSDVA